MPLFDTKRCRRPDVLGLTSCPGRYAISPPELTNDVAFEYDNEEL